MILLLHLQIINDSDASEIVSMYCILTPIYINIMGLKSLLLQTSNPPRRCLISIILALLSWGGIIWYGSSYELKKDGPVLCLEQNAYLRQEFNNDTLTTMLQAGDSVRVIAIGQSSYGQGWLVETRRGDVGWIDASDMPNIKQVLIEGDDVGDTVRIQKAVWTGSLIYEYSYINAKGEECIRSTSDFVPALEGWTAYDFEDGTIVGVSTQEKFLESCEGGTLTELNEKFGSPSLVHVTRDSILVQYNWQAFEPSTGKMWTPNVTFSKDSLVASVAFARPTDRSAWWLKILPLSSTIIDADITSFLLRGTRYVPIQFVNPTTVETILMVVLMILMLVVGFFWIFGTAALPVWIMGWLLKYPKVFKNLDDKHVMVLMFVVTAISCYVWSIVMMAWGMFPILVLFIIMTSWYAFTLAKSPLGHFPHQRCPQCREMFSIDYDHREFIDTKYHTGRDIVRGKMLGQRTQKWREWTEVTTKTTYSSGRTTTSTSKENQRTMARDYTTYEFLNYDVTYKVDSYRYYYKCEKCGFIEDELKYFSKEVDRKYTGSHVAEIAGEQYVKNYY